MTYAIKMMKAKRRRMTCGSNREWPNSADFNVILSNAKDPVGALAFLE